MKAETILETLNIQSSLNGIATRVIRGERLSVGDGILLYEQASPGLLGLLADLVRTRKNGSDTFYIRNFHIEPTNICINKCSFCSYSHHFSPSRWELSTEEIIAKVRAADPEAVELHITGAVHPDRDIQYYGNLLRRIREARPMLHLKAYSAVELDYMFEKSGMTIREGLEFLKSCGLDSIPGGGAEIFDNAIRDRICGMKSNAEKWLEIHETAHQLGIPSNATMLYGHYESIPHRIDHLERLRQLQDRTGGFNAFIPLKFRNANNEMSDVREVSVVDDMKMYAIARVYLDNFPHLKAYWPAVGMKLAQIALAFGVDDLDGTINDSTKIYSLAGAEEQNPVMTVSQMRALIIESGRTPVERDSLYNKRT